MLSKKIIRFFMCVGVLGLCFQVVAHQKDSQYNRVILLTKCLLVTGSVDFALPILEIGYKEFTGEKRRAAWELQKQHNRQYDVSRLEAASKETIQEYVRTNQEFYEDMAKGSLWVFVAGCCGYFGYKVLTVDFGS